MLSNGNNNLAQNFLYQIILNHSKNDGSMFLKSAKTELKIVRPTKLEKQLLLYLV